MAFIFSSSHLPETRVRRPDHLEDAEEEPSLRDRLPKAARRANAVSQHVMQPMPRAGGVRAFSHLPQPVRAQADFSDPLSARPATPVGRPRPYVDPEAAVETDDDQDTNHTPEPDSDHDDNTRAHEYQDGSPWHKPRITAQDLPPQSHDENENGSSLNRPTRSSGFDGTPHADRRATSPRSSGFSPSPQDLRDAFHSPIPDSPTREAPAQDNRPALPGGRLFEQRSAPEAFLTHQMGKGASAPSSQQRLQGTQQPIAAQQQVRGANPSAQGGAPAARSQAVSPYQGSGPDKRDEGRGTSSNNVSVAGDTGALRPGRSADPDQPDPNELYKISVEMTTLLLARRAVYDKMKRGNMPISTDELTRLMELDYQRGLTAKNDLFGMTYLDLMRRADDAYLYHIEPKEEFHPGYEGTRGSGFELEQSPKPQYENPHIKPMVRGKSDPYYSWEINYNVVGQWVRIAGYSKFEAAQFLAAWLAKSPSKWKSLHLDRQTWFWIGYDYAAARQRGWHPAGHAPGPKPGNYWWLTPPPASHPSRPQERRWF